MAESDDELLTLAHENARVSWTGIEVSYESFVDHVRARVPTDEQTRQPQPLASLNLHFDDLYLACACLLGRKGAVERVLGEHKEAIDSVARRVGLTTEARDDLVQILGERLFVKSDDTGPPGATSSAPPRIAQYTGSGPLRAWIKAVATRIALDLVRRGPRDKPTGEEPSDDLLVARIADAPDVQLAKETDRSHLREALRSSFATLSAQERNLLRYAILDGLGIDELAKIYQVHRATAARRLVASRDRLAEGVRQYLRTNLQLDESACMSLVRDGLSQVDLTLRTHLPSGGDRGPK
jgi:RNA polymerase sigma-70 factor, ECF subfamily